MKSPRQRGRLAPLRAWLRAVGFTVVLALLVAGGVGREGHFLPLAVVGAAGAGLGLLYWLFPRGLQFAIGTATGLALYASIYAVLGRAQFPEAPEWSRAPAFLLPVVAFLGMALVRRRELAQVAERQERRDLDHLPHTARWFFATLVVGLVCFVLPINRMAPATQATALIAAMVAISLIVALAVRDVVRLLVDVSLLMREIGERSRHLMVPATAFLLLYALLVVGFASAYRIADFMSVHELFHGPLGPIRITYSDALHFSVATLSTVGYGDIQPSDDGIRVLANLEVVAGQLLLLFGFAEIMRAGRGRTREGQALDPRGRDGHIEPEK
jgi:hypothetical protein